MMVRPWTHSEELHANNWTVTAAIDLLERRDPTRPFFLQLSFHRPHPPLDPPIHYYERYLDQDLPPVPVGDWAESFDKPVTPIAPKQGRLPERMLDRARRAYYAQINHLDDQIGRMIHYLKRKKRLDNTYIVFISDHGEMLGDHHMYAKGVPFEGSAKVPLIIIPPKAVDCTRGSRSELPVTHYDLMPTFLEEAGIPVPDVVEGSSLFSAVRGQPDQWRSFMHGEHAPGWQYVTDGREKYAWHSGSGQEWFFDLTADPQEKKDLSSDPEYAERMEQWRKHLIDVLAARPQDGLSDGERLIAGKTLPSVRPALRE
jgi:arylsulfatase A-like enzyme